MPALRSLRLRGQTFDPQFKIDKALGFCLRGTWGDWSDLPLALARIRSVLRRSRNQVTQQVYRCGDLWADAAAREAGRGDRKIDFAPREFDLLLFLLKHPGKAWTRDQLLEHVWGVRGGVGDSRTIDLHVRKLRRKIEDNPAAAKLLATVWGVGYRLNDEEPQP